MNLNHQSRRWIGLTLLLLVWGCSPMSYEQLMPSNYTPTFQNGLKANVEVTEGPKACVYDGPFAIPPATFTKALLQTAGGPLSESYQNHKYTLLVKNINCCLENNNVSQTPCTGKSYWAIRDNSSGHIIWQRYIEETGIGTFHWDGGKRMKMAISKSTQKTIASGLTALSQVDFARAQGKVPKLTAQWKAQRTADRFKALYEHLLYSAYKRIERDRDGYLYNLYGELMASLTKQYVISLVGKPDKILPGSGNNETCEWHFDEKGKETKYRISFFQNQVSGGTIRRKK